MRIPLGRFPDVASRRQGGDRSGRVSEQASALTNAPVTLVPTGLLTVGFRVGDLPGRYTATFRLNRGTSVTMFVDVASP